MAEILFSGEPSKRELLPLEKATSAVWNYFGFKAQGGEFIEKDKKKRTTVFCKLCPKQLPYNSFTTNMMLHSTTTCLSSRRLRRRAMLWYLLLRGLRDSHLLLRPFNTWNLFHVAHKDRRTQQALFATASQKT